MNEITFFCRSSFDGEWERICFLCFLVCENEKVSLLIKKTHRYHFPILFFFSSFSCDFFFFICHLHDHNNNNSQSSPFILSFFFFSFLFLHNFELWPFLSLINVWYLRWKRMVVIIRSNTSMYLWVGTILHVNIIKQLKFIAKSKSKKKEWKYEWLFAWRVYIYEWKKSDWIFLPNST